MSKAGCSLCGSKSPREIKVVLPTGGTYLPDIEILENGQVTLQLYGSQKTEFWSDFAKMYKNAGSWEALPTLQVDYSGKVYKLKFNWKEFLPGSGLYPFYQL